MLHKNHVLANSVAPMELQYFHYLALKTKQVGTLSRNH